MWGLIARPTNFDPNKKYPVIEYIYQGPGDQYVPKTFRPYDWNMKMCIRDRSLDMGSRCDETYGWELLLFLLSALYDSLRGQ